MTVSLPMIASKFSSEYDYFESRQCSSGYLYRRPRVRLRQLEKQDMVPDSPQASFLNFGKIVAFGYSTGAGST